MAERTYPFSIWRWTYINAQTKRRRAIRYFMTEEEARAAFGASAEKVPGTERVISGPSTDFGAWMPNTKK